MPITMNEVELRVLGAIVEKSLTQTAGYPMTVNAISLAASQKQNRDPVMDCSESDVSAALRTLEFKRLVAQAPPSHGARSVRFLHRVVEEFRWDRREQAVMAELILRGRQTPGELRTHASRMSPFAELESIMNTLNALRAYPTPFVEELPREPGRSANRFRHLLAEPAGERSIVPPTPVEKAGGPAENDVATLTERVNRLEREVAEIRRNLAELRGPN